MRAPKYLELLAKEYPSIQAAAGKIMHLKMVLNLPKGTEYFFSDLHGEAGAFIHLLRSASGTVRQKIAQLFENILSTEEQNQLANLVYDPEHVLALIARQEGLSSDWLRLTVHRLVELLRFTSSKYTRERIKLKTPPAYAAVIDELLSGPTRQEDISSHTKAALDAVCHSGNSQEFIYAICELIRDICVDQLHILGDIYDRGPKPHDIVEELMKHPDVDIQWGNHDIVWMGAAAGSEACIANVVRVAIGYNTFDLLEDGYAINLRPLYSFARQVYADDPCTRFQIRILDENVYDLVDPDVAAKMHKAISIIQFKLEGQLLKRHPEYAMDDRIVMEKVDWERMVYRENGQEYPLRDTHFPTVDPQDPLKLSPEEENIMVSLLASFRHGEALHRHINFLFEYGSSYLCINNNLLFHGCIPMTPEGSFTKTTFLGEELSGKELLDCCHYTIRDAWYKPYNSPEQVRARDLLYYLWCGKDSPMFGKSKMATFENFFVEDSALRHEAMDPYYTLIEDSETCRRVLEEFGLDYERSHIINGHVPVKIKDGESPVKAEGKYFVIDGGISKAYQKKTGIAGYTMIFNSNELSIVEHSSFEQIENDKGNYMPKIEVVKTTPRRLLIRDTDKGQKIEEEIEDLQALIDAYEKGTIKSGGTSFHLISDI